jgi:hypothetical protein
VGAAEIAMILRIGAALYAQYQAKKLSEEQLSEQWDLLVVPNFKDAVSDWDSTQSGSTK